MSVGYRVDLSSISFSFSKTLIAISLLLLPLKGISQWAQKGNGIYGGSVLSIATLGENLFAGTSAGLYKSSDNAITWSKAGIDANTIAVSSLVSVNSVLYAGLDDGVYTSTDGTLWTILDADLEFVAKLIVRGDKIYALKYRGQGADIYTISTADNVVSKLPIPVNIEGIQNFTISGNAIFVITTENMYSSIDGIDWNVVNTGFSGQVSLVDGNPNGPTVVAYQGNKTITSFNDGVDWSDTGLVGGYYYASFFDGKIWITKSNVTNVSTNGTNWTSRSDIGLDGFASNSSGWYGITLSGISKSVNEGTSWTKSSNGIISGSMTSVFANENLLLTSFRNNIFSSQDNGMTWSDISVPSPDNSSHSIGGLIASNGSLLTGNYLTDAYLSTTNGASWDLINGLYGVRGFVKLDNDLYASNSAGIQVSHDNGITWSSFAELANVFKIFAINDYLYVIQLGKVTRYSSDGSYVDITDGLELSSGYLATSFGAIDNQIFCGVPNHGVFTSFDNGDTWQSINEGLGSYNVSDLIAVDGILYAAVDYSGMYATKNKGEYWVPYNEGFSKAFIRSTDFNGLAVKGNQLFLATANSGIWAVDYVSTPLPKAPQEIVFDSFEVEYGEIPLDLYAEASSGLPITFTSSNPSVASVEGGVITFHDVGATMLTALQTGNDRYAAAEVTVRLNVLPGFQRIVFPAIPAKLYGDPAFTLNSTLFSLSTDLKVSYTSSDANVATVVGNVVTIVGVGTTTIKASQAGDHYYAPALEKTQVLTVSKGNQAITFSPLPEKILGDSDFILSATSNSGLVVSYTSSNSEVATTAGNVITIKGAGTTTITASQAGNDYYLSASDKTQELVITPRFKKVQSITFNSLPEKQFGDSNFDLSATVNSDLTIVYTSSDLTVATVSNNKVSIVGVGSTIIKASQPGDINYNSALSVDQVLVISKGGQSLSVPSLQDKTLNSLPFSISGESSSGLAITYKSFSDKVKVEGTQVTLLKAGRVGIEASQSGDNHYMAAPIVNLSFCIRPLQPSIEANVGAGGQFVLTSDAVAGNQWYFNDVILSGATNQTLETVQPGKYTVQVKTDDCESEFSSSKTVVVTGDISITSDRIEIYPNPVSRLLTLKLPDDNSSKQVVVYSIDGKSIEHLATSENELKLNVSSYESGIYILHVLSGSKLFTERFSKK